MKKILSTLFLSTTLAVTSLMVSGCSTSSGVKSTDSAATSMGKTAAELEQSRSQVAKVMTALNELSKEGADINSTYKTFSKEVSSLDSTIAANDRSAERMKATFQEYTTQWQQEISAMTNDELKEQSGVRRGQVMKDFEGVRASVEGVAQSFKPFRTNLQDLVTYIAHDLSPAGISAAGKMINDLKTEGANVQRDVQNAAAKIRSLQTSMGR